ncbi:3-isopropylmalate dehydratase small subunit [Streptomyces violaceusniger]|uniref:3-isopropylmalate dehydratase small subunit n=1 Tax=Streptomyces violaceusniger (strain Tu 4113) TaxID=653045 RepID=G2PH07_STRV4|nr:3-isopropylmalate dehydratase small subunit [Streptomyces violaceusniger]AEM88581.1 3-isopropylmalate dehydratase small subunit [Streptomyces violaceusniger Tu 4113]
MRESLKAHTGRALALRRDDVDTDQIIPAEFCKRLTKTGYADTLFGHWRKEDDFVLNRPEHQGASVLVAGHNFGTGSSREHAVWALRDWGFRAVIATSFGDIFLRNALKNGLLAVALPAPVVAELTEQVAAKAEFEITIDLQELTVTASSKTWGFTADHRARWLLLNGLDDIDVTLGKADRIAVYEAHRPAWMTSITRGTYSSQDAAKLRRVS